MLSLFSMLQRQTQERPFETNRTIGWIGAIRGNMKAVVRRCPVSRRASYPCARMDSRETVANTFDRITQNPNVLAGRATIRGLRISVAHVINLVANGMTPAQIVEELPDLEEEDVRQALAYAAALAQDELHPLRG